MPLVVNAARLLLVNNVTLLLFKNGGLPRVVHKLKRNMEGFGRKVGRMITPSSRRSGVRRRSRSTRMGRSGAPGR